MFRNGDGSECGLFFGCDVASEIERFYDFWEYVLGGCYDVGAERVDLDCSVDVGSLMDSGLQSRVVGYDLARLSGFDDVYSGMWLEGLGFFAELTDWHSAVSPVVQ